MAEAEKSGVPTVSLVTGAFERVFTSNAKVYGVPDLPHFVVSEQPLVLLEPGEIEKRVEAIADMLLAELAAPRSKPAG